MKIKINLLVLFTIIMLFSNVVFADENIKINCNINNNNIIIPTNRFTFGIMVLEPNEKIKDIKKAKNVTVITHFVLLFLFFDILFPF